MVESTVKQYEKKRAPQKKNSGGEKKESSTTGERCQDPRPGAEEAVGDFTDLDPREEGADRKRGDVEGPRGQTGKGDFRTQERHINATTIHLGRHKLNGGK